MPVAQLRYSRIGSPEGVVVEGFKDLDGEKINLEAMATPAKRDASAFINDAIDEALYIAGGGRANLYLPRGFYRINGNQSLAGGITISGPDEGAAVIILDKTSSDRHAFKVAGTSASPLENIGLFNLRFDGSELPWVDDGTAARLARFDFVNGLRLAGLTAVDCAHLAWLANVNDFDLERLGGQNFVGGVVQVSDCQRGSIRTIRGSNLEDAVDLFMCDEVELIDIMATGRGTNELVDIGSSRNIRMSHLRGSGFSSGVTIKTEQGADGFARTVHDITLENFSFDVSGRGVLVSISHDAVDPANTAVVVPPHTLKIAHGSIRSTTATHGVDLTGRTTAQLQDSTITDVSIDVPGIGIYCINVDGLAIRDSDIKAGGDGVQGGLNSKGVTVAGGRIDAGGIGVYNPSSGSERWVVGDDVAITAGGSGVELQFVTDPLVRGARIISAGGRGIYFVNCRAPRAIDNDVDQCGRDGVLAQWTSVGSLDTLNDIIGAVLDRNRVRNFGLTTASSVGVYLNMALGAGETGTYNLASLSGNRAWIDENGVLNSQYGIRVLKGHLAVIDYAKVDNNLIFNVPTAFNGMGGLGANSTKSNNTPVAP